MTLGRGIFLMTLGLILALGVRDRVGAFYVMAAEGGQIDAIISNAAALARAGHIPGLYIDADPRNPDKGVNLLADSPRYSTGYGDLARIPRFALVLGNETSTNRQWEGVLRLVAVHNRALTGQQIQQNFEAGVGEIIGTDRQGAIWNGREELNFAKAWFAEHTNRVHLLSGAAIVESVPSYRGLGLACAVGILVAVGFVLVVLPAVLVYAERGVKVRLPVLRRPTLPSRFATSRGSLPPRLLCRPPRRRGARPPGSAGRCRCRSPAAARPRGRARRAPATRAGKTALRW